MLLFLYLVTHDKAFCQQKFEINYYYQDSTQKAGFYFRLFRPLSEYPSLPSGAYDLIEKSDDTQGNLRHTMCIFSVGDTSTCSIGDGFGHLSFIIPGDEVSISFKKMIKTDGHYRLNGKYTSPFFHEFIYKGKNKYIYSLFDSLAYNAGDLIGFGDIGFKHVDHNLPVFFDTVTKRYNLRVSYLNAYCAKYQLPKTIKKLAFLEIKANYINNLLEPIQNTVKQIPYNEYPKAYIDTLNSISYDDPGRFFKTFGFDFFAFTYISQYQNRTSFTETNDNEEAFKRIYNTINNKYKCKLIREQLMAWLLVKYYKQTIPSYDAVLNEFGTQFPGSKYFKYIDSIYNNYTIRTKVSLKGGLAAPVTDYKGNNLTVENVIGKRPVIIDCWASWCAPCLQQFPYSEELEIKYAGEVDFVYLSFDKDKQKWIDKSAQLLLKNNSYLLDNYFKSNFANHFDIETIPRYIIFDKHGQLVNANAPRPSDPALTKLLDKLITE